MKRRWCLSRQRRGVTKATPSTPSMEIREPWGFRCFRGSRTSVGASAGADGATGLADPGCDAAPAGAHDNSGGTAFGEEAAGSSTCIRSRKAASTGVLGREGVLGANAPAGPVDCGLGRVEDRNLL